MKLKKNKKVKSILAMSISLSLLPLTCHAGNLILGDNAKIDPVKSWATALGANSEVSGNWATAVGDDAKATSNWSTAIGMGAKATGGKSTAMGNYAEASAERSTSIGVGSKATAENSTSIGVLSKATADNSTAIGLSAEATANNAIALGANSIADREKTVSVGSKGNERQITNVKAGTEDTDAVNVAQLKKVNNDLTALINSSGGVDALLWDSSTGSYSAAHNSSSTNRISNVADGINSNDAVNLSQLNSVKTDLTNQINQLGEQVNQNTTNINNGVSNSDLTELQNTVNQNTTNISQNTTDITQNTTDISDLKNSVTQNTTDIANLDNRVTTNETNITNIDDRLTINEGNTNQNTIDINNIKTDVSQNSSDITNINNQINDIKTNGAGSALIQNNPSDKTVIANATASNSLAVGSGSQATANNAIALGTNSVADRENTVSIGSKGNERQITNVKAGTEDTDAVNFSQLKQVQTSQNAFEKSTNLKFQSVYEKIEQNQKENRSGISSAMAMGAIPQAFQYGSGMMGLGVASYKGESALAIGVSRVSENGHWVSKFSASANSNDDYGVSVGIGYSW